MVWPGAGGGRGVAWETPRQLGSLPNQVTSLTYTYLHAAWNFFENFKQCILLQTSTIRTFSFYKYYPLYRFKFLNVHFLHKMNTIRLNIGFAQKKDGKLVGNSSEYYFYSREKSNYCTCV